MELMKRCPAIAEEQSESAFLSRGSTGAPEYDVNNERKPQLFHHGDRVVWESAQGKACHHGVKERLGAK